jgi:hypothetical protein
MSRDLIHLALCGLTLHYRRPSTSAPTRNTAGTFQPPLHQVLGGPTWSQLDPSKVIFKKSVCPLGDRLRLYSEDQLISLAKALFILESREAPTFTLWATLRVS